jgi:hypothetical protein
LLEGRAARLRIQNAAAVGTAEGDVVLATYPGDVRLQLSAVIVSFGKAAVINDGGADAMLREAPDLLQNGGTADAKGDDVRSFGEVAQARIATQPEHLSIFRVDRIHGTIETNDPKRLDDPSSERWPVRGSQHGDRTR